MHPSGTLISQVVLPCQERMADPDGDAMTTSPSSIEGRLIMGVGDGTGSDVSEKDCTAGNVHDRSEGEREEGRATDDEHASCSDQVSVEGGSGSDTSRPGSGTWDKAHLRDSLSPDSSATQAQPPSWPNPSFSFTSPTTPKQGKGAPQADGEQQMKLARLLLSRGKVGSYPMHAFGYSCSGM